MNAWYPIYRLAQHEDVLEACVAVGGEPYGMEGYNLKARPGMMLCRNPKNGYVWAKSREAFDEFYCAVGEKPTVKAKPKRAKKTTAAKKKTPASNEEADDGLFAGFVSMGLQLTDEGDEEEECVDEEDLDEIEEEEEEDVFGEE